MKKALILITSVAMFLACNSQETSTKESQDHLTAITKGLTEMSESDFEDKQLMLDGNSIKVYSEEGQQLKGMKLMKLMMSGDYMPKAYVDDQDEVKVVILAKATEDEKKQMKLMVK